RQKGSLAETGHGSLAVFGLVKKKREKLGAVDEAVLQTPCDSASSPELKERFCDFFVDVYGDHVQHFKVLQDRSSQYFIWEEVFSSLNELVEFYHSNSIAKERTVFLRDPEHFARRPHHAHALFDFTPHHPSQLHFFRGDVIDLLDCSDSLRWRGRCHGRVGFFPPEYVQPIYQCQ
ncbi:GRB2-related adapter protein-like, partial [Lampris incognitus]|uniref:GRB2-related adapter protein-like n=1 Tax=Lampris incognitus TaxID=2546036 RepID=UPI0024B48BF6